MPKLPSTGPIKFSDLRDSLGSTGSISISQVADDYVIEDAYDGTLGTSGNQNPPEFSISDFKGEDYIPPDLLLASYTVRTNRGSITQRSFDPSGGFAGGGSGWDADMFGRVWAASDPIVYWASNGKDIPANGSTRVGEGNITGGGISTGSSSETVEKYGFFCNNPGYRSQENKFTSGPGLGGLGLPALYGVGSSNVLKSVFLKWATGYEWSNFIPRRSIEPLFAYIQLDDGVPLFEKNPEDLKSGSRTPAEGIVKRITIEDISGNLYAQKFIDVKDPRNFYFLNETDVINNDAPIFQVPSVSNSSRIIRLSLTDLSLKNLEDWVINFYS